MEEPRVIPSPGMLETLEELRDDDLYDLMIRAQGILLDRPALPDTTISLAVEIVEREEGRLLATYRALTPGARQRLLGYAADLAAAAPARTRLEVAIALESVGV